jgi:hypothetical protein
LHGIAEREWRQRAVATREEQRVRLHRSSIRG